MKKSFLLILTVFLLASCKQKANTNQVIKDSPELAKLFSSYWDERMHLFPIDATANGDNRFNDQLPNDISDSFRANLKIFYTKYLDSIKAFNADELNANDKISYAIFKREMEMSIEGLVFPDDEIPFQQFWGLPLTFGQMGSGDGIQPFKTVKDYDNFLGRIKGFSIWCDTAVVNMRRGMNTGVVLPKSLVIKMIPQMEALVVSDAKKSLFYGPINKLPSSFSTEEKTRLTEAYTKAILTEIVPSYKKLGDFLKNEYLAKSRASSGIADVPGGSDRYKYLIRYWTTTDMSPEEIYQTGLDEVERLHSEMERIKNETGFKGDQKAFFNYLKTDSKFFPYQTPREVISAFENIQKTIDPNLKKMFGRVPKTAFEIRQTEAFRAASASAEYQQGTGDGSRPGIFYIPIVDAKTFNITSGMESLFLHEAIPGHHYQISLQQENQNLPSFRRYSWYGAYGEGWALYCESLGKELGLYTNPYQYMGALGDEIHRAIRLVVDVGIHTKGWTREQAIKYMTDNEAISEEGATAEIERYMAIPAQALSYKIGALKIRQLRLKYEKQLGDKFSISDFHDELLKDGCMPLDVLENKMDDWAKSK